MSADESVLRDVREANDLRARISAALDVAASYAGFDGAHHKSWTIDQIVRALTGCPMEKRSAIDVNGQSYEFSAQGESDEYRQFVKEVTSEKTNEDGEVEREYEWEVGIAP